MIEFTVFGKKEKIEQAKEILQRLQNYIQHFELRKAIEDDGIKLPENAFRYVYWYYNSYDPSKTRQIINWENGRYILP